jgi:hypothetical protein
LVHLEESVSRISQGEPGASESLHDVGVLDRLARDIGSLNAELTELYEDMDSRVARQTKRLAQKTASLKISPRLAGIGNPAMAYLVGVGAAVIIGGSVLGTVFPQTIAGINLFDVGAAQARGSELGLTVLEGLIALVGTAATLLFFHFGAPSRPSYAADRGQITGTAAQVGQVFLAVTLGAVFAGVYIAALTALVERAYFVLQFIF